MRRENDKCRDYTVSPLTDAELTGLQSLPGGMNSSAVGSVNNFQAMGHSLPGPNSAVSYPPQNTGAGINDLAMQLSMLAQQSGLALTPAAAAATASFMALTAQGGNPGSTPAHPANVLNGAALGNAPSVYSSMQNQAQLMSAVIQQSQPSANSNVGSSNVLIVSNLNEEVC